MGVTTMTRQRRSKEDHFAEEAEKRVNFILKQYNHLGKLSSRATNTYSTQQVAALSEILTGKLRSTLSKFSTPPGASEFQMPRIGEDSGSHR